MHLLTHRSPLGDRTHVTEGASVYVCHPAASSPAKGTGKEGLVPLGLERRCLPMDRRLVPGGRVEDAGPVDLDSSAFACTCMHESYGVAGVLEVECPGRGNRAISTLRSPPAIPVGLESADACGILDPAERDHHSQFEARNTRRRTEVTVALSFPKTAAPACRLRRHPVRVGISKSRTLPGRQAGCVPEFIVICAFFGPRMAALKWVPERGRA